MRTNSWMVVRFVGCLPLLALAGCFSSGAKPPGANAPCATSDSCPSDYQCLPATNGGSGLFCCKDKSSCGSSGSGGNVDGAGSGLDGTIATDGPPRKDGSVDGASAAGSGGNGFADSGRGGTGGGGDAPVGGITGSGGVAGGLGSGGVSAGGTGGLGAAGAGGANDAAPDLPQTTPDAPTSLPLGKTCAADADCALGHCVDGICCDKAKSACSECNACANVLTGLDDGTCGPVSVGKDPHDTCPDETATLQCGRDGTCDGKGACRLVGSSHVCTPASCSTDGKTFTPATTCDGKGACSNTTAQPCAPFQCATTGCLQTCTVQTDCVGDTYCNTSISVPVCAAKKVNGLPASQPYECKSNVVADGVCCDKTCSGCSACTLALNKQTGTSVADGQCLAVVAGQVGHGTCTASPPCGLDGLCDGNGACRYTTGGTSCATDACSGSTLTTSACVTSTHTCVAASGPCPNSTACANATGCGTKKVQGAPCTSTADCAAGACADRADGTGKLCCASACSNACQACAIDGSACTTKTAGVADSACGTTTNCHTGACASGGACQLSSAGTNCSGSLYCTSAGQCTCQAGGSCPLANPCQTGTYSCATGTAQCVASGNQPATVACGAAQSCSGTTKYLAQMCNGTGACAPQTTQPCPANQTCSGNDCACNPPNQTCNGACVNTATDSANCGACGHSCLGGACVSGQCQPAAVVTNAGTRPGVFGLDNTYVYYTVDDPTVSGSSDAYRINKDLTNGSSQSYLGVVGTFNAFSGVMGTKLFNTIRGPSSKMCDVSNCAGTWTNLPGTASGVSLPFAAFKSPSPTNIAQYDTMTNSQDMTLTWYATSGTKISSYTEHVSPPQTAYWGSFVAFGDTVYWIRQLVDASFNTIDWSVYSVSSSNSTRVHLAGSLTGGVIIDANAKSLLLSDLTSKITRIPLPVGLGSQAPQSLTNLAAVTGVYSVGATEDASGAYWLDTDGSLYRCVPSSSTGACTGTTILASGQAQNGGLVQSTSALYWGNSGTNQVMRLAK